MNDTKDDQKALNRQGDSMSIINKCNHALHWDVLLFYNN